VLGDLVGPWAGTVYRHVATGRRRSVLDDTYLGVARDNRWNREGTPAYYFASDLAVTVAEFARHIASELPDGASERLARTVWRVPVSLAATLDLTDPAVVEAAGAPPIGGWILDREATQATAAYLLAHLPRLQALVVPSIAFLDRRDRPNLVVYRDRVDPATVFGRPVRVRTIVIEAAGLEA
jgi:RES domain-containing protein